MPARGRTAIRRPPARSGPGAFSLFGVVVIVAFFGMIGAKASAVVKATREPSVHAVPIPGTTAVQVNEPGPVLVYYDGSNAPTFAELGGSVTAPDGSPVAVASSVPGADAPESGRPIATFQAQVPGTYQVAVRMSDGEGSTFHAGRQAFRSTSSPAGDLIVLVLLFSAGAVGLVLWMSARNARRLAFA
jgi:hypothetical protein